MLTHILPTATERFCPLPPPGISSSSGTSLPVSPSSPPAPLLLPHALAPLHSESAHPSTQQEATAPRGRSGGWGSSCTPRSPTGRDPVPPAGTSRHTPLQLSAPSSSFMATTQRLPAWKTPRASSFRPVHGLGLGLERLPPFPAGLGNLRPLRAGGEHSGLSKGPALREWGAQGPLGGRMPGKHVLGEGRTRQQAPGSLLAVPGRKWHSSSPAHLPAPAPQASLEALSLTARAFKNKEKLRSSHSPKEPEEPW